MAEDRAGHDAHGDNSQNKDCPAPVLATTEEQSNETGRQYEQQQQGVKALAREEPADNRGDHNEYRRYQTVHQAASRKTNGQLVQLGSKGILIQRAQA